MKIIDENPKLKNNVPKEYLHSFTEFQNEILEKNENLKNSIKDQENNEFIYRFAFQNKNHLNEFKDLIEKEKNIKKIEVQFV